MIFIDQLHREIEIKSTPKRIVSLVPSQSELLWSLGLKNQLVGITKFCIHPDEMFESIDRVGGTKNLNLKKIRSLQPDVIIANKEENEKNQLEELAKEFPVWISDIKNLDESLQMINLLGALFQKQETAKELAMNIKKTFNELIPLPIKKRIAYFIWKEPMMLAGRETFINDMLQRCGFENVFLHKTSRYPETSTKELQALAPEIIFLSSEPFPFKEKHLKDFQQLLPSAKILIVDGELFSWYGSRLIKSANYFKEVLRAC